eukprot:CAMPEP_0194747170 /NCGR_PEP_ID=MMETSP0323_2-20130528/1245_2 /TAXON_ID=2866 ORGANISM="Crypthecodinium cohnii, Strain Seligo" /NCGR_SAMPLE_ID=MMETSP0323_2 /ASSEMBLY_ACC=CAM_ASM_000346 /LENGTH=50 /DNA_ID= /DNA_START= /DNA_END= /DNA_ORIENTATION=
MPSPQPLHHRRRHAYSEAPSPRAIALGEEDTKVHASENRNCLVIDIGGCD